MQGKGPFKTTANACQAHNMANKGPKDWEHVCRKGAGGGATMQALLPALKVGTVAAVCGLSYVTRRVVESKARALGLGLLWPPALPFLPCPAHLPCHTAWCWQSVASPLINTVDCVQLGKRKSGGGTTEQACPFSEVSSCP